MSHITDKIDSIMDALRRNDLVPEPNQIKSVSIDYKEMGEFAGDLVLPIITIVSKD